MKISSSLRQKLERVYEEFSREEFLPGDPLGALDRSLSPEDLEVLSFLIAGLSYGRVENIYRSYASLIDRLVSVGLGATGAGIVSWLCDTPRAQQSKELERVLKGWVHRLNSANDIKHILIVLGDVLRANGSLAETYLLSTAPTPKERLVDFCAVLDAHAKPYLRKSKISKSSEAKVWRGTGPSWFYANPVDGSTCKRLLMWLRWMARKDAIDLGLWKSRFPEHDFSGDLFWPVDTHIHQWAKAEGITSRKSVNWAFVEELTQWGKTVCPEDPIRYDFAICQSGMRRFRSKREK